MAFRQAFRRSALPMSKDVTTTALFRRFLSYLEANIRQAFLSGIFVLAAPLVAAGLLWSFKLLIDDVLIGKRYDHLTAFAALYVAAISAKIALEYFTQLLEASVVERIVLSLRSDVYDHVLSLSPLSLDKHTPGDVLSRLKGDTNHVEFLIYTGPLGLLADGAAAVVFVGFLFLLSWQLTLCTLVAIPAIILIVKNLSPHIRKAAGLSRQAESQWMSLAEERFNSVPVVQAFSALSRESKAFRIKCAKVRDMEIASRNLQARQSALVEVVVALAGLAVLAIGANLIMAGAMTTGALVAFIGTVSSLYAPIRSLAKASGRFQVATAGAERITRILDRQSLVVEKPDARLLEVVRGGVAFRNVSFCYPGSEQIALRSMSLTVTPGEMVAIVGPSGSGKSSLIKLLLRQFDCDEGSVLLDGHDIRDLKLDTIRHATAPVFQDPYLLNGTIEKNIRYGKPSASPEHIQQVVDAAAVSAFATSKGGLMTPVGTSGSRLSGGQRQRIAIARAMLSDAPILVFDEATAGVDSETEELIHEALDRLRIGRTIIVVAHRLSTVRGADRVIVVENGRVVEQGTPDQLLSKKSRCRALFEAQLVHKEAAE